jgi:hypothetical protein
MNETGAPDPYFGIRIEIHPNSGRMTVLAPEIESGDPNSGLVVAKFDVSKALPPYTEGKHADSGLAVFGFDSKKAAEYDPRLIPAGIALALHTGLQTRAAALKS